MQYFQKLTGPYKLFFILTAAYVVLAAICLSGFLNIGSVNFILGIIAIASAIKIRKGSNSNRYAYLAIFIALLSLLAPVTTAIYFAIGIAFFFLIENLLGRLANILPLIALGFASPIFKYAADVFSFPIRFQLTQWAGSIFSIIGAKVTVSGNIINYNESEFAVDPECMGLSMLVTSLLIGVILISHYINKYDRHISVLQFVLYFLLILLANILGNLIRIIILVQFAIAPGTSEHEIIGLISLLIYIIIPGAWLASFLVRRYGKAEAELNSQVPAIALARKAIIWNSIIIVHISLASFLIMRRADGGFHNSGKLQQLEGYSAQRISAEVVKLENEHSLIYIKHIPSFYHADHHPMVCWKGSGYVFNHVLEKSINGVPVFMARLQNKNDVLYTAWWYDNGVRRTTAQLSWRTDVLTGGPEYSLINVTAASKKKLDEQITKVLSNNHFKELIQ